MVRPAAAPIERSPMNDPKEPRDGFAIRPEELDWRPMSPGIATARLHRDPERGLKMMLLRFEPGGRAPRHLHPEGEQYYVLEGEVVDETGTYGPGAFVHHPPGSVHAPSSPAGALVLVTWFGRLSAYDDEARP